MTETFFADTETPNGLTFDDTTPIVTGTYFKFAVDGLVTHARWFASSSVNGTPKWALYRVDDSHLMGEIDLTSYTQGAWNTVPLGAPIPVVADTRYVAAYWSPNYYVATNHYFDDPITRGNLLTQAGAGQYKQPSTDIDIPTSQFSGTSYFIDLVFEPGGAPPADAEGSAAFLLDLAGATAGGRESAGTAPVVIDLAPAATGARASAGLAPLVLDLHAAASGGRSASGSAALGLGLALGASGGRIARSDQPRILSAETSDRIESAFRPLRWEV